MSDGLNREGFTEPPLGVEEALAEVMARAGLPPGMRDHQAEQDHAEFTGWFEAQGYTVADFEDDDMREAFTAGMSAARDLGDWFEVGDADDGTTPAEPQPAPELTPVEAVRLAVAEDWQPLVDKARDEADRLRALLDHETRLTWQSGLPGERARVAGVRERAGLEAL